nr:DegV family protein [Ardenticatena sp.]
MIQVLTDSTADIPPEVAAREGLLVVPAQVIVGDHSYREGVELTSDHLFRVLRDGNAVPQTSLPRGDDFAAVYQEAVARGAKGILAVHIGSGFSGLLNASRLYAREVPIPTAFVDSGTASMALGWLAIYAARRARQGVPLETLAQEVQALADRAALFAMLDTLEFARRGGRVGRLAEFVAGVLNIKPILRVAQNEVTLMARTRSRRRALDWLCTTVAETAPHFGVAVLHADALDLAHQLAACVRTHLSAESEFLLTTAGAVLGAHAGPGAVGVALLPTSSNDR